MSLLCVCVCVCVQVVDSPEVPNLMFSRVRDSIALSRDKPMLLLTPEKKDDRVHKEIQRRLLEKKYESSPNLLRKKEALSQVFDLYTTFIFQK